MALFPRIAGDPRVMTLTFNSSGVSIGSALIFPLSSMTKADLIGISVINSTIRDAYLHLIYAPDLSGATNPANPAYHDTLLVPAKGMLLASEEEILKVQAGYTPGSQIFVRFSESHINYVPFLKAADGEISGSSTVRGY